MKAIDPTLIIVLDGMEMCPDCGHAWIENGPAHFADCRYFSLDDDRDEEVPAELQAVPAHAE